MLSLGVDDVGPGKKLCVSFFLLPSFLLIGLFLLFLYLYFYSVGCAWVVVPKVAWAAINQLIPIVLSPLLSFHNY